MPLSNVVDICEALKKEFPNPDIELDSSNLFTFLVAVVLSAQTTDKRVNLVTKELFKVADSPEKMLKLGEYGLCKFIRSVGLYRSKAKHIIALSKKLIEDFDGKVPDNKEDLMTLSGVGSKTANVIINHGFGRPAIAVDTHVFRVSRRLGLSGADTPAQVELDLEYIIPDRYKLEIGYQILLHGRYVCKAQKPNCSKCCLKDLCPSDYNT